MNLNTQATTSAVLSLDESGDTRVDSFLSLYGSSHTARKSQAMRLQIFLLII